MAASQFILLPERGAIAGGLEAASALLRGFPQVKSTAPAAMFSLSALGEFGMPDAPMLVIDTLRETGAKLVEMDGLVAQAITDSLVPLRAVPVVTYSLPDSVSGLLDGLRGIAAGALAATTPKTFTVECHDALTGGPLAGCQVVAFQDYARRIGVSAITDAGGRAVLTLRGAVIERLYAISPPSHWGGFRRSLPLTAGAVVRLGIQPVSLSTPDAVRTYYNATRFETGMKIKVGVIDTGVGPHGELHLQGGRNTVTGELRNDTQDWKGHGTHVAGLIGALGSSGGLRGMAPGVEIHPFRVFGRNSRGATNYAIMKAMIHAAEEECDIINLSLGGGPADSIVMEAIQDARNQGMLVIVAAGNDGRQPVSNPAAYPGATAVSALGLSSAFPPGCLAEGDIERPPASAAQPDEFIAGFSNFGAQIAVTAPGVGVLSTLPHGGFGPMSGTSMAAPVAAGAAACLLSRSPGVHAMARDANRAGQIELLLRNACNRRGFAAPYVGSGMPDPAQI